jgi:DNA invertase Pin-like site-specific DNA recombinase
MVRAKRFVSYLRVSREKQGADGLGIAAQRTAVASYLASLKMDASRCTEFVEVESGKRNSRPVLAKALRMAKLQNATLVIAKLDRLSRNAHFLTGLKEAGVDIYCCDLPNADRLTFTIMSAVAEKELEQIQDRTRKALAEARKRVAATGQKQHPHVKRLGNPNGASALLRAGKGNVAAVATIKASADETAERYRELIEEFDGEGLSANGIAGRLNDLEISSPRRGKWTAKAVLRAMTRLNIAA